jgi:hypothetical protein
MTRLLAGPLVAATLAAALTVPAAKADAVAYLVNVTVRPGYNFPNARAALDYGNGICDTVSQGRTYPQVMSEVKQHFDTTDEYQAAYLINQAVNELCPALIWQLRNSATQYRPPSP